MFTRICVSPNYHISSTGFKNRVTYLCFLIKLNIILSDVSKCWHLIKIVLCSLIQDLESSKSEYTFQIINVCVRVCIVNKFWSRNQKENFCESRAWCPPHSDIKGPLVYNLTYGLFVSPPWRAVTQHKLVSFLSVKEMKRPQEAPISETVLCLCIHYSTQKEINRILSRIWPVKFCFDLEQVSCRAS